MKKLTGLVLLGLATLLTGCLVTSVYPFHDQKSLVSEPALLGDWDVIDESGKVSDEHWKFVKKGTNSLEVTYFSDDKSSEMLGYTFKLNGELFVDLLGTDFREETHLPPIPSHFLLRVQQLSPTVKMTTIDYEWLAELLEEHPKAVRHHAIVENPEKPDAKRIVLTADTQELQRFVIKHLKTTDAWAKPFEMKHGPARQPPQKQTAK